jgi:nucleoside-diphosphate-sugar epimerase
MAILVTGGTGFLGSYFVRYCVLEQGIDGVVVLDRHVDRGKIADVLNQVTVIEGDVTDAETVRSAIDKHEVDRVAHFAFMLGSPAAGQMIPYVEVQCLGTATVFETARVMGVERVLFCSSVAAYGQQKVTPLTEDLVANPSGPYGSAKVWGEALGRHYTSHLALEVVSLRFGSTYGLGRGVRGSYRSGVLDLPSETHYMARVEDAVRGKPIVLPSDDAVADWTYAADLAQAVWLALTAARLPQHLYNVCAERRPVGDFTRELRQLLPDADITTSNAELPGHAHPAMDNSRIIKDLGFSPKYSLEAGLRDYISRIRAYDAYSRDEAAG